MADSKLQCSMYLKLPYSAKFIVTVLSLAPHYFCPHLESKVHALRVKSCAMAVDRLAEMVKYMIGLA